MSIKDFIIAVYCLVDKTLKKLLGDQKLRQRGFKPSVSDSEMITMMVMVKEETYYGFKGTLNLLSRYITWGIS